MYGLERGRVWRRRGGMLLPLLVWLTGCAHTSQPSPQPVPAPTIPPLPPEARQPPAPAWCSPSCSRGLTAERESWLPTQIKLGQPERPASGPMMR